MCECYLGEITMCTAVDVRDGNNVRSGGERLENVGGSSRARTESERIAGMLESSDCALKVVPRDSLVAMSQGHVCRDDVPVRVGGS